MENIKKWIKENSEQQYKEFSERLTDSRAMMGVRIPKMRTLCKQIAKEYGLDGLEFFTDDCFEEVLMQGFIIGYSDELIEIKEPFIYEYLLKCDNWSLVDSFSTTLKLKGIEKEIMYSIIQKLRCDEHEYVVRFALVKALDYLSNEYIDDILLSSKLFVDKTYAVKMANAWLLATAYINYPEKVREASKCLDDETFRMTKRKIRDSFRVSEEEKRKFER